MADVSARKLPDIAVIQDRETGRYWSSDVGWTEELSRAIMFSAETIDRMTLPTEWQVIWYTHRPF